MRLLIHPSPLNNLASLEYFQQLVSEHCGSQDNFDNLSKDQRKMEIFRLDKAIDNEKLDLEMAIAQLKKEKEHLSQSLKRRKELPN